MKVGGQMFLNSLNLNEKFSHGFGIFIFFSTFEIIPMP
jgi:hypothetical protein